MCGFYILISKHYLALKIPYARMSVNKAKNKFYKGLNMKLRMPEKEKVVRPSATNKQAPKNLLLAGFRLIRLVLVHKPWNKLV